MVYIIHDAGGMQNMYSSPSPEHIYRIYMYSYNLLCLLDQILNPKLRIPPAE